MNHQRERAHRRPIRAGVRALAVLGVLGLAAAPAVQASPLAVPLHTHNQQIIDANGNPVLLHGVEIGRMSLGEGEHKTAHCGYKYKTPNPLWAQMIGSEGFNTVRLGISWANIEPTAPTVNHDGSLTHHWDETYLRAVDTVVNDLGANGVSVILEMHQSQWSPAFTDILKSNGNVFCQGQGIPAWFYPDAVPGDRSAPLNAKCEFMVNYARPGVPEKPIDGLVTAWQLVASRYASDPNVIGADLLNEPSWATGCADPHQLLGDMYTTVGNAIHAVNNHMLIMYENGTWASWISRGSFLPQPVNVPNAVYSWHWYPPDWNTTVVGTFAPGTGMQQLQGNAALAASWNQPFWIGEFNLFNEGYIRPAAQTDPNWQADSASFMAYARTAGLSWSFHCYNPGSGSELINPKTKQPRPLLLAALQNGL
jgi:hypothetical protein